MSFDIFQNIMTASDPAGGRAIKVTLQTGIDDAESYYTKSDSAGGRAIKVSLVGSGALILAGNVPLSTTPTNVADGAGNTSPLQLSTNQVRIGNDTTGLNITQTGALTSTAAGAASTPALSLTGTPFVGTGTTSVPLFYLNGGAAPTTWNSAANGGTYIGINATSAFAGNFIDFRQNGGTSIFSVNVFGGFQTGIGATSTLRGNLQTQNSFTIINKSQTSYLTFITRNTTGSEVVMDLTNIGTIAASGAISIGNTVASALAVSSTHKVTVVIGGVTYYLLASNV